MSKILRLLCFLVTSTVCLPILAQVADVPSPDSPKLQIQSTIPPLTGNLQDYVPAGKAAILQSRLKIVDPKAVIIEPADYQEIGKDSYSIRLPDGTKAPEIVYLRKRDPWLRSAAALYAKRPVTTAATEFFIAQLSGDAQIFPSAEATESVAAVEGATAPLGSRVETGEGASVALLLPGEQTLRLGPLSTITVNQTTAGTDVKTEVDLRRGAIFSQITPNAERKLDFRVRTPKAVAAVKGTEFVVFWENEKAITCLAKGTVSVETPEGQQVAELGNVAPGDIAFRSVPPMNDGEYAGVVDEMLGMIRQMDELGEEPAPAETAPAKAEETHPIDWFLAVRKKGSEPVDIFQRVNKAPLAYNPPPAAPIPDPIWTELILEPQYLYPAGGALLVLLGTAFFLMRRRRP